MTIRKITNRDSKGRILKGSGKIHGLSDSPIYDCWIAMKARCNNLQHPEYKNYGGRGISVCRRWELDFKNFLEDMGSKPSSTATLDRINVNGNYTKENCRWISIQEQQKNRRDNHDIVGIRYEPDRNRWRANITYKGKSHFLGRYKEKDEAIKARAEGEGRYWNNEV